MTTRILLVEDEALTALDIRTTLEQLGYDVCGVAGGGEAAVANAETLRPDLILMDIGLKGALDGVEAAALIRGKLDIPVIFVTAHSDSATLQKAKLTEPFGYVLKPIREGELQTAITLALYKNTMDRKLKESHRWLEAILRSIGDAVIATDADGRIILVNRVAEALTGWGQLEAIGQPLPQVFRIVNEETRRPVENPVTKVLRENAVVGLANHTLLVARDGREIGIDDSGAPIRDDAGRITGVILIFRDATARRQAEQALQESEARYEQLAAQNRAVTWEVNAEGLYTYVSGVVKTVFGYRPEELTGKRHFYDLHPEAGRDEFRAASFKVFARKKPFRGLINPVRTKSGRTVWVSTNGLPVLGPDGRLLGYRGTDTDITPRVAAAKKKKTAPPSGPRRSGRGGKKP